MKKAKLILGLLAIIYGHGNLHAQKNVEDRPNIIFIVTDDQHRNQFNFLEEGLSVNGLKTNLTPTMDKLVEEGVVFDQSYVSSSVCTPSRYSILTGNYASWASGKSNIKKYQGQTNVTWNVHIEKETPNIAKELQKNGYFTGGVGKNHVIASKNPHKIPLNADPSNPEITRQLIENQQAQIASYKEAGFDYAASLYKGNLPSQYPKAVEAHNMDWIVDGALTFLDKAAQKEEPFFLYLGTTLSHGPHKLGTKYKANPLATPMGFLEEPLKIMPSRASITERIEKAGLNPEKGDVLWLDDGLTALIDKLKAMGTLENTVLFFINDHGVEHGKGTLYEGGIKTVSFAWGPKFFKKGIHSNQMVSNIDLVPTALELAGVQASTAYKVDGESMLSLLNGDETPIHESLYFEMGATRAILKDGIKYLAFKAPEKVKYELEKNGDKATHLSDKPGGRGSESPALKFYAGNYFEVDQLYNIKLDKFERTNLYNDKLYQQQLKDLKSELKKYIKKLPGTFPIDGGSTKKEKEFKKKEY